MTHSNIPTKHVDLRFNLHTTINDVKERFRTHIGTPVEYQRLILRDSEGRDIRELSDNSRMLGFYSVTSGMEIHIIDTDPFSLSRNGGLTDVTLVEKYKISDEAYDKRKGTMRDYIREQRKLNPNFKLKPSSTPDQPAGLGHDHEHEHKDPEVEFNKASVEGITVGSRCEVEPGARRGVVKFVGEVENVSKGFWVSQI
jgi:tubulin-folding cofactor B